MTKYAKNEIGVRSQDHLAGADALDAVAGDEAGHHLRDPVACLRPACRDHVREAGQHLSSLIEAQVEAECAHRLDAFDLLRLEGGVDADDP
jgi:hypothetical protein